MARKITYQQAINEALDQEMSRDQNVIVMGEDVAGGEGSPGEQDAWGGVLGVTRGLYHKHPGRVIDTPISESGYVGAAIGAACCGMRPVAELMFVDFLGVCFDQIFNQAAKFKYMFGGKAVTPVVIRTMYGAGFRAASQHSQCLYPLFTHIPGLKVALPSNPYEAKGLLIQSIHDRLAGAIGFYESELTLPLPDKLKKPLEVHGREGEPCTRCGEVIQAVHYKDYTLCYCPAEQTGGQSLNTAALLQASMLSSVMVAVYEIPVLSGSGRFRISMLRQQR